MMFKKDDRVFSYSLQEWGKVVRIEEKFDSAYPLVVNFTSINGMNYTLDGRAMKLFTTMLTTLAGFIISFAMLKDWK